MGHKKKMISGFLLGGLLGLVWAGAPAAAEDPITPAITVVGMGTVSATPDQGQIRVGVVTQRTGAAQAMQDNSAAVRKVFGRLAELGVSDKDIQTTSLDLNPVYARRDQPRDQPKIIGYEVINQIRILVRDVSRMGSVLDAVVREGANRLDGISFAVANPGDLLDEARSMAVEDAHRKAQLYAAAAGIVLGPVIAIQEVQPHLPRPQQFRLAQAAESVPIAPGQLDFGVSITVLYRIGPGETK